MKHVCHGSVSCFNMCFDFQAPCVLSVSLVCVSQFFLPLCCMFVSLCLPVLFLLYASPLLSHLSSSQNGFPVADDDLVIYDY